MKKYHILITGLLFLNSIDILYLISFKLGFPPGILYIVSVSIVSIFVYNSFGAYTYANFYSFTYLILYFIFQLINGLINSISSAYSLVTFISFALTIYLMQIFSKIKIEDLFFIVKKIFYYTIIFYLFIDISSILVMGKSQHVLLSNILPFLLLSGITISLTEQQKKESIYSIIFLLLYAIWLYISVMYFTSDQRIQMKAIPLALVMVIIFIFLNFIGKLLPEIRSKISLMVRVPVAMILVGMIFLVLLFILSSYLYDNSLEGRETSLGLRINVARMMLKDIFDGSDVKILFGYGLGSSMKTFPVDFGTQTFLLRSHSGLLSLFYEHGLVSIVLIGIMIIRFFFKSNFTNDHIYNNKKHYRAYSFFLLLFLFFTWTSLNIFYIIAINVPNYGHQTQLVSVLLLAVYLNRVVFGKINEK